MKKNQVLQFFKSAQFIYFLLAAAAVVLAIWQGSEYMTAITIAGMSGGKILSNEPLTTDITRKESPDLLISEVDRRIVKIRPVSTPIDQISRLSGGRQSGSLVVDFYSIDVKPTKATLLAAYTEPTSSTANATHQKAKINTSNNDIFEVSETILVQGVKGYEPDGTTQSKADLVIYVSSKEESGELNIYAINGKKIGQIENCVPSIAKDVTLVRMGRAATELDVQTAQFDSIPIKDQNYCQIFKMQVEQSTFQKIAKKEVAWKFSDAEESAAYDMRLGMEKTFMFGVKRQIFDAKKKMNIHLTGGIWWQAGKEFVFDPATGITQNELIDIMKEAFTGNGGNKQKVLVGGSEFIGRLNKLEMTKVISANDKVTSWGIDFSELRSKFGSLLVLFSEVFDECGMSDYGFVFDPEFITKWSHVPFDRQKLSLKEAGIRNTDAIVLTEASCLTLRYPAAHMRITPKTV